MNPVADFYRQATNEGACWHCGLNCSKRFLCVCEKYGVAGHEEAVWCSLECMENSHPDEWPEDEVVEDGGVV